MITYMLQTDYVNLQYILTSRYLDHALEFENTARIESSSNIPCLKISDLTGDTPNQRVTSLLSLTNLSTKLPDKNNFIKEERQYLFKMLDVIWPNSKKNLRPKYNYKFSIDNAIFLEYLLLLYREPDGKAFLKGNFDCISYKNRMKITEGALELARNEYLNIDIIKTKTRLAEIFNNEYREMLESLNTLNACVKLFGGQCGVSLANRSILDSVSEELNKSKHNILVMIDNELQRCRSNVESLCRHKIELPELTELEMYLQKNK